MDDFGIAMETTMQFDALAGEGVDAQTVAIYRADAEAMDALEVSAYQDAEVIRRETRQPFVAAKVHQRLAQAVEAIEAYQQKLDAIDKGELAQLRGQIPREPVLTELQAHSRSTQDLYILGQLGEALGDPLTLRICYLDALERGNAAIVGAIERDPMQRSREALQPDDLRRGSEVKGLVAAPDVAAKIRALEALKTVYGSRIATALTRLRRGGWMPPDALVEMAAGAAPNE